MPAVQFGYSSGAGKTPTGDGGAGGASDNRAPNGLGSAQGGVTPGYGLDPGTVWFPPPGRVGYY